MRKNMRKTLFICILSLVAAHAAGVSDADRKTLTGELNKSSKAFLASVKGLSDAQLNFKAAPDRWSILECAEHIAMSEDFIREMITSKVLASQATPDKIAERKPNDAKILPMVTDRSQKFKAPEPLDPTKKHESIDAIVEHFNKSRAETLELAQRDDLRDHAGPHPAFKELDAWQWTLYLSGHTQRHTAQILEVKADSGFPKK